MVDTTPPPPHLLQEAWCELRGWLWYVSLAQRREKLDSEIPISPLYPSFLSSDGVDKGEEKEPTKSQRLTVYVCLDVFCPA